MNNLKGLISRIERFSIHDGPGIRTLIVMKGCPLRCLWCSSPQTQFSYPELVFISHNCTVCGQCVKSCKKNAILSREGQPVTDRGLCDNCGDCVDVCSNQARIITGKYYSPQELFLKIKKDTPFYRRSGGGVTIGGGEALYQSNFVEQLLLKCKATNIHTAMETSAYLPWGKLEPLVNLLDLIFIDIKHMEESQHIRLTGTSNQTILENVKKVARIKNLILRLPVVPGLNDSLGNILNTATFAKNLGTNMLRLELLPYHRLGIHHYGELGREYTLEKVVPPSDDYMLELKEVISSNGVMVAIGGS